MPLLHNIAVSSLNILVVGADLSELDRIETLLTKNNFKRHQLFHYRILSDILPFLQAKDFDVVLLELELTIEREEQLKILRKIQEVMPDTPLLIIDSTQDDSMVFSFFEAGVKII